MFAQKADSTRRVSTKDTTNMESVVVSAKTSVRIKGDTVTYTVDSLTKNPNATAEDVLKRLPGVEITSDGKIMVNGKEVTKIFVNGKMYTTDDMRTLTQNMPAQVLEKMQLADWYDEETQFTGIKTGTKEKMLNLKIKKNYEQGIYGQLIGGLGTKNTYQAGTFTNYMDHSNRVTVIAKANNTGLQDVGITNSGNADNTRASTPSATGTTTRRVANISFSNDIGTKLKLSGNYDAYFTDNAQSQTVFRNTYLPGDSSLLLQQNNNTNNKSNNHKLNVKSELTIDSTSTLTTEAGLSYKKNAAANKGHDETSYNTTDNLSFVRGTDVESQSEGYGMNLNNSYRKRFRDELGALIANVNVRYNKDNNTGDNNYQNQYFHPVSQTNTVNTIAEDKNTFYSNIGLQYSKLIAKWHTINFRYANTYNQTENNRNVWNVSNNTKTVDTNQTREYDTHNTEHNIGLTYQLSTKKVRANIRLEVQPFKRDIIQNQNERTIKLPQSGMNYTPGMSATYNFSDFSNVTINYNVSIRQPYITQLQPMPDYRDSLNIILGNTALLPETSHYIYLDYNYNTKNGNTSIWTWVSYNQIDNKIINKTDITASRRVTTYINANGFNSFYASLGMSTKLTKWLKQNISFNASTTNNIVVTNGVMQTIPSYNITPSTKFVLTINELFEGEVSYSYRMNSYNSATNTTNILETHTTSLNGTFTLPHKIRFIYFVNYIHNTGFSASYNPDFVLVNSTIEKGFKKPSWLYIRAQGFDVFNNYPNVQRSFGDNYFEDRSANRLGRFFMFSLICKFTYFPNK
ncbi:MAG: outer membrane beta-barrel protein [Bacteroidetes bacterium]|nr:outer membrane beta-barrel protein [Bacteroidota bacterium]